MEERLITTIDDAIRREAKAAAAAGKSLEESCRWTWSSPQGRLFTSEFIMHKAALAALGMSDKTLTPD